MNTKKRWLHAAAGVAVLLFAGLVYAWSALKAPIAAEFPDWTKAQLNLTFTLVMIFFCLGGLFGGVVSKKLRTQWLVVLSAALFAIGFYLASRTQGLLCLYLSFGVLCGTASGFAYNAVMSAVSRWFPDKPGRISGILLMGFGIGSFLVSKLYEILTPRFDGGWRTSFLLLGGAIFAVLLLCAALIAPPKAAATAEKKRSTTADCTPGQMLRRSSFWLFYLWATLLTAAGLMLVPEAGGIAKEVGDDLSASTAVGIISICNGFGRVLSGLFYDRAGRRTSMQTVNGIFLAASAVLLLAFALESMVLIVMGFLLTGIAYGGVPPVNSAFAAAYYGQKHYPVNYPIINTNLVIASFSSTLAASIVTATGSHRATFYVVAAMAVVGILCSLGITLSDRKK